MIVIRRLAVVFLLLIPVRSNAQSLLDRSPNLSGDWVGTPGSLYFHFIHRFTVSDAPARKVSNVPTFLFGAGFPKRFFAGFNYSTNSTLAPNFPNEWELFARWQPVAEDLGAPLDVGGQVGYNNAADGVDGEVSVAKRVSRFRVIAAGRALSDPLESGNVRFAFAGGGTLRLGQYVSLAGDVASLLDRDSSERVAWSAGIHFAIPLSPHTLSLHATNAPVGTLQGESRGSDKVRYGFEFTIPVTLGRYFGKRAQVISTDTVSTVSAAQVDTAVGVPVVQDTARPLPATLAPPAGISPAPAIEPAPKRVATEPKSASPKPLTPKPAAKVRKVVIKNISYLQPKITVAAGTIIEWTNADPLPHSVTAVDKSFNSGLIQPGKSYRHTFTRPGTYNFFCMPHPFMKGVVVVTAQ